MFTEGIHSPRLMLLLLLLGVVVWGGAVVSVIYVVIDTLMAFGAKSMKTNGQIEIFLKRGN